MTNMTKDRIIGTDWSSLTLGERIKHLEVEGYVVIPDLLSPELVDQLRSELTRIETQSPDYTDKKHVNNDMQWAGGAITELIAHEPTLEFLRHLFGDEVILMSYEYVRSDPGCPAVILHSDGMPWGSSFGASNASSCPKQVRVLYYLQDLTRDSAPFRVVPRSQLSFHNDANPYIRYKEHPEQVMVTCRAGSAAVINQYVFHGNYPNQGDQARELLGFSYRPSWAGPNGTVEPWDPEKLANLSPDVRAVMQDRNTRIWEHETVNVPADARSDAPGMNPSRWEWE